MAKGSIARLHNFQPSPFLVALLAPFAPFGLLIHAANVIGRQTPSLRQQDKVKGQSGKPQKTSQFSPFTFQLYTTKKDILSKMSFSIKVAMPTRGSVGCDANAKKALVATKGGLPPQRSVLQHRALGSQRSAFRLLLSHKCLQYHRPKIEEGD